MLGVIKRAISLRIVTWIGYVCPAIVRIGERKEMHKESWRGSVLILLRQLNV